MNADRVCLCFHEDLHEEVPTEKFPCSRPQDLAYDSPQRERKDDESFEDVHNYRSDSWDIWERTRTKVQQWKRLSDSMLLFHQQETADRIAEFSSECSELYSMKVSRVRDTRSRLVSQFPQKTKRCKISSTRHDHSECYGNRT